jgi:hypothetical protein
MSSQFAKTLADFQAKQEAELAEKVRELAEFEKIGEVPGLNPWLIQGKLYGVRHVAYKLTDLQSFLDWAQRETMPIYGFRGKYAGFYARRPDTRDYQDAEIIAEGNMIVSYSSILRELKCYVFVDRDDLQFKLSFDVKGAHVSALTPTPQYSHYRANYHGRWIIESWHKTNAGQCQFLRVGVDRQSANLETLMSWCEFCSYFGVSENENA